MPRKDRQPAKTETPRFLDPHRAEIEEDASARRGPVKPPANSPILCCECGREYLYTTWEGTVAAFRAHEDACQARRAAPARALKDEQL